MKARILIVDDDREFCLLLGTLLRERGHTPECVHSGEAAIRAVGDRPPDLVLLDLRLDGIDGIETLRGLRASVPASPIVMLTAFGNVEAAVTAMKCGATDFLSKPFDNQALLSIVDTLLTMHRDPRSRAPAAIGQSPTFRKAMRLALLFAVPDINVLLVGETGTGKEQFARTIHAASKRSGGPFVAVDCSTLAENLIESELFGHEKGAFTGATAARIGRLELAHGGTLFLDEIANLPVSLQAKLLRVLQERTMEHVGGRKTIRLDIRVVSATNVNLKDAIRAGTFRQDLYYRLREITVCLPPLRERDGDIQPLAEHFVRLYAARFGTNVRGVSEAAVTMMEAYAWPGNVRELENAMKSAVVLASDVVRPEHLPPEIRDGGFRAATGSAPSNEHGDEAHLDLEIEVGVGAGEINLKALGARAAAQAERQLLQTWIRHSQMSGAQMAKRLGVDPKTLRTKLRRYGLGEKLAAEG